MLEVARFGYSGHWGPLVVQALFPMRNEVHSGYRLLLFSIPSCPGRRVLYYTTHVHVHYAQPAALASLVFGFVFVTCFS